MLLGQAGEFVFVILALAGNEGIIGREQAQFCILVASITMLMTPLVARLCALAVGFAFFALFRRSVLAAILGGEAAIIATGWWFG